MIKIKFLFMGLCLISRKSSWGLHIGVVHKLDFFRRMVIMKDFSFCKMYKSASVLVFNEDTDTGSNFESNSENEIFETFDLRIGKVVHGKSMHEQAKGNKLFAVVVRVLKSLDWQAAREISFLSATEKYGFDQSINSFMMMVHTFACAEMHMKVHALLREIICCYQKFNLNLFGLFSTLMDCSHHAARSTLLVDVLIKVFASNRMFEPAVAAFFQARHFGLQLGIRSSNFLLKCLAEANHGKQLITLFEDMKEFGPSPSVYTYTIMIQYYCNMHRGQGNVDIEQATNILKEMDKIGISPSVVTYSSYIRGLCRHRSAKSAKYALDFVEGLRTKRLPLNCYCYNAVIHGFCNADEPEKAMQLLSEMKSSGITPDTYSYSILIEGFCKCGDIQRSLSLLEEMENSHIKPSIVTYSSLFKGLCRTGSIEGSLDVFQKGTSGVKYDQHAYNVLITGYCKLGNMDSANKLFEQMIINKLAPNALSYKTMIHGFSKTGSFNEALKFFSDMIDEGFWPNTATCNSLINGYCSKGCINKAVQLIGEMTKTGIAPNNSTYNLVINALCKERKPEKALELIPLMLKSNVFPSVKIYSTIIDGFAKQANQSKALMLYVTMLRVGVAPDAITLTIIINVLCNSGKVKEAYSLFQELIWNGIDPDKISYTYTTMIAGFCRKRDMKQAWALFQEMVQKGHLRSVVTYTCLIDGFFKVNKVDMVDKLVEMMKMDECVRPDVVTYYVLKSGYQRLGQLDRAQKLDEIRRVLPDDTNIRAEYGLGSRTKK